MHSCLHFLGLHLHTGSAAVGGSLSSPPLLPIRMRERPAAAEACGCCIHAVPVLIHDSNTCEGLLRLLVLLLRRLGAAEQLQRYSSSTQASYPRPKPRQEGSYMYIKLKPTGLSMIAGLWCQQTDHFDPSSSRWPPSGCWTIRVLLLSSTAACSAEKRGIASVWVCSVLQGQPTVAQNRGRARTAKADIEDACFAIQAHPNTKSSSCSSTAPASVGG